MAEYVTVQGDMWDSIAYKIYGTESRMSVLMDANPTHISTVVFGAGITLAVPELETPTSVDLPPWKRGAS